MNSDRTSIEILHAFDWDIPLWLTLFRVLYGSVFIVSGILKLIDLPSFVDSLASFRVVPPALLTYVSIVIPFSELILGISLVSGFRTALMSSFAACIVAVFSGAIAEKLIEGAHISCGCFGPLSGDTLTGATLVRNAVLCLFGALLAAISARTWWQRQAIGSRQSRSARVTNYRFASGTVNALYRAGAIFIALFILCLVSLTVIQNTTLKNRLALVIDKQVLALGDAVPAFVATNLDSTRIQVQYDDTHPRTLLLLFSTQCKACRDNLPYWGEIVRFAQARQGWRVLGISLGSLENSREFVKGHTLGYPILATDDPAFRRDYKASLTPFTVVVDSTGRVAGKWTGILDGDAQEEVIRLISSY